MPILRLTSVLSYRLTNNLSILYYIYTLYTRILPNSFDFIVNIVKSRTKEPFPI